MEYIFLYIFYYGYDHLSYYIVLILISRYLFQVRLLNISKNIRNGWLLTLYTRSCVVADMNMFNISICTEENISSKSSRYSEAKFDSFPFAKKFLPKIILTTWAVSYLPQPASIFAYHVPGLLGNVTCDRGGVPSTFNDVIIASNNISTTDYWKVQKNTLPERYYETWFKELNTRNTMLALT